MDNTQDWLRAILALLIIIALAVGVAPSELLPFSAMLDTPPVDAPRPTPTPEVLQNATVLVSVNIRACPDLSCQRIGFAAKNSTLLLFPEPVITADGYLWRRIARNDAAWIVTERLAPHEVYIQ